MAVEIYKHEGTIALEVDELLHWTDPEGTGFVLEGEYQIGRLHIVSKPQNSKNRTSSRRLVTVWVDREGNRIFESMPKYRQREAELKLLCEIDPYFVEELRHHPLLSFLTRKESAVV